MDSFELNKIMGAILGTCLVLMVMNLTAGAVFSPIKAAKPEFRDRGEGRRAGAGGEKEAAPAPSEPIEKLLRRPHRRKKARLRPRSAPPAIPLKRVAQIGVGPNLYDVVEPRPGHGSRLQLFRGHEGQGRQVDLRRAQQVPGQPEGGTSRAPPWASPACRRTANAPTSSTTCIRWRKIRHRCPPQRNNRGFTPYVMFQRPGSSWPFSLQGIVVPSCRVTATK